MASDGATSLDQVAVPWAAATVPSFRNCPLFVKLSGAPYPPWRGTRANEAPGATVKEPSLVTSPTWSVPELSSTSALASLVSGAAIWVKSAYLLCGSWALVSTLPKLRMVAPDTAAKPPVGLPGSLDPPSVESSRSRPCAVMVLAPARVKDTVLTCSLLFDVLPWPAMSRVCVPGPVAAPRVSERTSAPLWLGSAVPMVHGASVTV